MYPNLPHTLDKMGYHIGAKWGSIKMTLNREKNTFVAQIKIKNEIQMSLHCVAFGLFVIVSSFNSTIQFRNEQKCVNHHYIFRT